MTSELLKVGLIGAGSMGHLHARTVVNHPRSSLTWVQDVNVEAARKLAERYESRVLREPDFHSVDAVIVASSTPSHFDLASHIIHHGLPLLIEKPLCEHLSQVETLIAQSSKSGTVL